jgi:hypothetical protein
MNAIRLVRRVMFGLASIVLFYQAGAAVGRSSDAASFLIPGGLGLLMGLLAISGKAG